ncbi:metalloregulator ArsR/SmtB family transcription factor [Tsukamurella tyrosinosolvens]|nr:metalloregulator ArsR/SmtB family transcription factor [Tsukamurella tyrosinosolvens]MEC4612541.1 metalloregulator ArsR/SmtB family transcription factor [Tsukamurella tyrosinosolvens]
MLDELGNNRVVKYEQHEAHASSAQRDGDTRDAVVGLLMNRGQATAADIGEALGITTTAVRRHLDNLLEAGDVTVAPPSGLGGRGRGRPAKEFLLTPSGRRRLGQGYDALAVDALRALREVGGEEAVRTFARRRAEQAIGTISPTESADPVDGARRIAASLSDAGFSADAREVGNGVQICQHHCPVSEVASEFPELCEAEISAIEQALGTHVQRLATIANGDRACTTHVPLERVVREQPAKELR